MDYVVHELQRRDSSTDSRPDKLAGWTVKMFFQRIAFWRSGPTGSEMQLQHQLKYPGIEGAGDGADSRGAKTCIGCSQRRRVGGVERFNSEFRPHLLLDGEHLGQHDIKGLVPWSDNRIARTAAQCELRRLGKRRSVEPAGRAPFFRGERSVSG